MDAIVAQSLSYCYHDLTLTEASGACSCLDVIMASFVTSRTSCQCSLGVIWPETPGKVHDCSKFLPFVDNDFWPGSFGCFFPFNKSNYLLQNCILYLLE